MQKKFLYTVNIFRIQAFEAHWCLFAVFPAFLVLHNFVNTAGTYVKVVAFSEGYRDWCGRVTIFTPVCVHKVMRDSQFTLYVEAG